ncbi:hypothetical protein COMA2_30295 [Candidatus Nitrospira nitrificans]|uniref:Uncharacterized protein n=1 Tax=Candidatus Nitrospira nitrificans TaxID=1742973 RepID=A0A0S4LLT1_9BACT|nr:hypothetical protein COMA2_30295 [Candidatus Nitrospira nitrificans]
MNDRGACRGLTTRRTLPGLVGQLLIQRLDVVQVLLGEFLKIQHGIVRASGRTDDLVQFELNRRAVTILGVLDQEDHQERHNGGAGIDDQLPGVAEMENWAGDRPGRDNHHRNSECSGGPEQTSAMICQPVKYIGVFAKGRRIFHMLIYDGSMAVDY